MENNTKKRGRPLGSTNKKSTNGSIYVTSFLEKQIEGAAVNKKNSLGWVNWGAKNNYCLLLLDLYANSPTHHSCIDFGVQSIIGAGVDYEAMQVDGSQVVPNYTQTWEDLLKALSLDYMLYGTYALQIIKNKDNKTFSFYHMPMEKVRFAPYDEDGQITKYYVCADWTQPSINTPIEVDAFGMQDTDRLERGKPYLFVYRPYSPTSNYYPSPHYLAALKAIQAEIQYLNYDLKNITNGFVPSGLLLLNEVETDEERMATIRNVQNMFIGSEQSNSLMISFRRNMEEKTPEFVPFNIDAKADRYEGANTRTISRILAAHQIPSPLLIGMPDIGNNGFSSDSTKIETSYMLYNKLTGNSNRLAIVKTINEMFKLNGVDTELILKPLRFALDRNDTSAATDSAKNQDTSTDNIEEQVDGSETINNE